MEESEAIGLLLKHVDTDRVSATVEVQETARKIAECLGCLALAVDLAGAYISEQRTVMRPYNNIWSTTNGMRMIYSGKNPFISSSHMRRRFGRYETQHWTP